MRQFLKFFFTFVLFVSAAQAVVPLFYKEDHSAWSLSEEAALHSITSRIDPFKDWSEEPDKAHMDILMTERDAHAVENFISMELRRLLPGRKGIQFIVAPSIVWDLFLIAEACAHPRSMKEWTRSLYHAELKCPAEEPSEPSFREFLMLSAHLHERLISSQILPDTSPTERAYERFCRDICPSLDQADEYLFCFFSGEISKFPEKICREKSRKSDQYMKDYLCAMHTLSQDLQRVDSLILNALREELSAMGRNDIVMFRATNGVCFSEPDQRAGGILDFPLWKDPSCPDVHARISRLQHDLHHKETCLSMSTPNPGRPQPLSFFFSMTLFTGFWSDGIMTRNTNPNCIWARSQKNKQSLIYSMPIPRGSIPLWAGVLNVSPSRYPYYNALFDSGKDCYPSFLGFAHKRWGDHPTVFNFVSGGGARHAAQSVDVDSVLLARQFETDLHALDLVAHMSQRCPLSSLDYPPAFDTALQCPLIFDDQRMQKDLCFSILYIQALSKLLTAAHILRIEGNIVAPFNPEAHALAEEMMARQKDAARLFQESVWSCSISDANTC